MKTIKIYFHEVESNWCRSEKTTMLYLAKTKGFPVNGSLLLEADWDKVKVLNTWEDQKDMCVVWQWEECE
ncbi:hypothetical protein D3C85_1242380 [compost metagenome]